MGDGDRDAEGEIGRAEAVPEGSDRTSQTGWLQDMQNWADSGFRRPQFRQRIRTSPARISSRSRTVLPPPAPVTAPTRRKIHHRRTSQPPTPARTPPMTKSMIAPKNDWKNVPIEKESLTAAPMKPEKKPIIP